MVVILVKILLGRSVDTVIFARTITIARMYSKIAYIISSGSYGVCVQVGSPFFFYLCTLYLFLLVNYI